MLSYLADRGCRPEGIDLSPEMVRHAARNHSSYPTAVGSLTSLDYPDKTFDGVFAWYSTIHNPDGDFDPIVAELVRVTRSGGYVLLGFQVGQGSRTVGKGFAAMGYDVEMTRYYRTVPEVVDVLVARGLDVVARMERAAAGNESDPQAIVIAHRRG